jgi:peptide/nickel transport system substrate-binding protein
VLRVATIGEPPSLDLQWSTGGVTQQIGWHVYETLYTYNHRFEPIPMLARGHVVEDGGRRYVITLRHGVRFHNGKPMAAADVVASLRRWGRIGTIGRQLWSNVVSVEPRGNDAVVIQLRQPSAVLLSALARPVNGAVIHPVEAIAAAGAGPLRDFIGTGPYRLAEHRPDRHVRLVRFGGYAARPEDPDGYGGRRTAHVDEILFIPVPDPISRLTGLEAGEYDVASQIPLDSYARLLGSATVSPHLVGPPMSLVAVLNHRQGLMASRLVRRAFQAALSMEAIMLAAAGSPEFYRLDGALFPREQARWHSSAGTGLYDQGDAERARQLLREAGYRGEPLRWLTSREYEWMYRTAVVAKQQLEQAGFVVDLQVMDSATLLHYRTKPERFDVVSSAVGFAADPALSSAIQCAWAGWWCQEAKEQVLRRLTREGHPARRRELLEQIQQLFYEDVGRVKLGDIHWSDATRKTVRGFVASPDLFLWNTWLGTGVAGK